ncbi:MAG: BamA/TamA family outer membrane protein [Gemmatimonadaceae bacterium]|nr:BamA/TamA family outer membrane protein [Gemmatimonadaceae bacterium]
MRTWLLGWCLALGAGAAARTAAAQGADSVQRVDSLSYDDAAAVAYLYNLPAALRATSGVTIAADQTVDGNVAVLEAPLTIAGHVTGRVVVINGNVILHPGARVDGDVTITGGTITGTDSATFGGTITVYRPPMAYRMEDDRVVAVHDESGSILNWFRRWKRRHQRNENRIVVTGGTYNRVEGFPVLIGPSIRRNGALGRFQLDARGIYRSADHFTWKAENLGYTARADMQFGVPRGVAIGVEAFDVVDAVEAWHLRDNEIGLASFFLRRDYRDYYNRKGARGYVALRDGHTADLTLSYGEERWHPRAARDPFTLFRNSDTWRANPVLDAGNVRLLTGTLTYDTRNNVQNPWTGWLITASVEHGWSSALTLGPTAPLARAAAAGPVRVRYTSGFLDARRYNRVSPRGQLNLRLVLGGWLGGDPLPLERRLSVGGSGTLPGYDFRQSLGGDDVLTCSDGVAIPGTPAQCERLALVQAEYRGDLHLRLFGGAGSEQGGWSWSFYHPLQWVAFIDAGRGWLLHERASDGSIVRRSSIPPLDTFRSDVGLGLDAEVIGVFLAKSLTDSHNDVNVVVRLRHRF